MSSTQLVKQSEWSPEFKADIIRIFGESALDIEAREQDVLRQNPDDDMYQLASPEKYCDTCRRRLFNFEVIWDESNSAKDEHCCEICWLLSK